jgi:hypothetical protein
MYFQGTMHQRAICCLQCLTAAYACYQSDRRRWDVVEYAVIGVNYVLYENYMSLPLFLTCKLFVSLVYFIFQMFLGKLRQAIPILEYVVGREPDRFRPEINFDGAFDRYVFPGDAARTYAAATDWTRRQGKKGRLPPNINFTGQSLLDASTNPKNLLQNPALTGKCHDWAASTISYLAADTFLTRTSLAWIRLTTWLIVTVNFLLLLVPSDASSEPSIFFVTEMMVTTGVLFDMLRTGGRNPISKKPHSLEKFPEKGFMFGAVKATLTATMCFYLTHGSSGPLLSWRWAHYFVFVASTFLCSKILRLLLTSFCWKV